MKANEKADKLRKLIGFGVPDWIRTNDTQRRRLVLYPTELLVRSRSIVYHISLPFSTPLAKFVLVEIGNKRKFRKRGLARR